MKIPREITLHRKPAAVVLSRQQYGRLTGTGLSLAAFTRRSPLAGEESIDVDRIQSLTREVEL
ncbi:hypothetical protein [Thiolapillus brandeum]|uniref:Prevent-host-death family protein n=1 Tax=Thiolapillus brandeum TaxID=1076588 RepID=A0A7U6GIP4_9GAMM|nr:hypothetical protein [Thiolapillus brandeum]BAO44327.1 prevent-host-death family protein [Thiolapillus brandeum]